MKNYFIILSFLCTLFLSSCQKAQYITYVPNSANVVDPVATIKETIESQPKAQEYMPAAVEVTDKYITLFMIESGGVGLGFVAGRIAAVPKSDQLKKNTLYFKNIGVVRLIWNEKYDQWYVEIYDKEGSYFNCVFTYNRTDAERFIDAVDYMVTLSNADQSTSLESKKLSDKQYQNTLSARLYSEEGDTFAANFKETGNGQGVVWGKLFNEEIFKGEYYTISKNEFNSSFLETPWGQIRLGFSITEADPQIINIMAIGNKGTQIKCVSLPRGKHGIGSCRDSIGRTYQLHY